MMEMLQEWLLGLTAAALAVSLLTAMLPKGETIRRIAGLAGGLILLLAVVQPLLRVRWEELTWRYETYQREMDRQTEAYQAAYADSLSGDIADRTAAYISEKAASLGIDCRVQVEVRTEDGLPLPYGASLDVERDQVLSDYMAQESPRPAGTNARSTRRSTTMKRVTVSETPVSMSAPIFTSWITATS